MNKMISKTEQAMHLLKEKGFKYTKRRESMIHFLIQCNRYVSAREVYESMKTQFAGVSYDTVYRNLHDFERVALVEKTELHGEQKFRYRSCQAVTHHHHFICLVCGKIKEIHMCPMDFFEEQLLDCEIEGHRFEIFGKCENCRT